MRIRLLELVLAASTTAACTTVNDAIVGTMSNDRMCYLLGTSEPTIPGSRDAMRRELARRAVRCDTDSAPSTASSVGVTLGTNAIERLRGQDWEGAIRQASAAVASGQLNQDQLAAMFLVRAYAYWKLGRRDFAKRELQFGLEVKPDSPAALKLRDEFAKQESLDARRTRLAGRPVPRAGDVSPPVIQF